TQDRELLEKELGEPGPERIWYVGDAFAMGLSVDEVYDLTKIDKWFLVQIEEIVKIELDLDRLCDEKGEGALAALDADTLRVLKKKGFSDRRLAKLLKTNEKAVREARRALNVRPVYKRVDTCAAEFPTNTAYMYS
ncbi:carbamoyl phosphate synthase large subunit, partial [Rhizobium leguminosarum]|nr:carbamoyl phosphate synthase large subunit [Rhizobium ruizarguesonis]